jgi:hypothetical protein
MRTPIHGSDDWSTASARPDIPEGLKPVPVVPVLVALSRDPSLYRRPVLT